jgi:tetratricopeptide (TPR) repeat protein
LTATDRELDFFGLEPDLRLLEKASRGLRENVALAWYLRQRDPDRALELILQSQPALAALPAGSPDAVRARARFALVRAEVLRLRMRLAEADAQVQAARQGFESLADAVGIGDSLLIEQGVAGMAGDMARRIRCNEEAAQVFKDCGDELRWRTARAYRALADNNLAADTLDWDEAFARAAQLDHPGLHASLARARSWQCYLRGDLVAGTRLLMDHYENAIASGQIRTAIYMLLNVADNYVALGAFADALDWVERGLALARQVGWTKDVGYATMQMGDVLRRLGRKQAARQMFDEALALVKGEQPTSEMLILTSHIADLLLHEGDHQAALDKYREVQTLAHKLDYGVHLEDAYRGQALALHRLGQTGLAQAAIEASMAISRARKAAKPEIDSLRVLGQIALGACMPPPPGSHAPTAAVHYLELAIATAKTLEGYVVSSDLHHEMSLAYEAAGDLRRALDHERAAVAASELSQAKRAADLAMSLEIRYQCDKARTEAEIERLRAEGPGLKASQR